MQMTGEQRIAAPRQQVWEALNDPEILRQCIPGCQSLERDGENRFLAVAEVKIGPIGARFKGSVQLSDLEAPSGYTITGSGNGGIAGSAKGGASVRLGDMADGGTLVSYKVDAEVGGRMAQLGGPIIDATAKNLAGKFFKTFGEVVSAESAETNNLGIAKAVAAREPGGPFVAASGHGLGSPHHRAPVVGSNSIWGWIGALVVSLVAGFGLGQIQIGGPVLLLVGILLTVTSGVAFEAGRRGAQR